MATLKLFRCSRSPAFSRQLSYWQASARCNIGVGQRLQCQALGRSCHWWQKDEITLYHRFNVNLHRNLGASHFRCWSSAPKDDKASDSSKDSKTDQAVADDLESFQKLSLFQKFKAMYRDYWYVLVPVHISTSVLWLGVFYYAASSGVDLVAILEKLNVSETLINPLRDSSAGYVAITYALYKIFTPFRYTVTLGGTTWAIRFLKERGMIKPRPMKDAKENMQNIVTAMKMPRDQRQQFLEDKGMPRIGKAVSQASPFKSDKKP